MFIKVGQKLSRLIMLSRSLFRNSFFLTPIFLGWVILFLLTFVCFCVKFCIIYFTGYFFLLVHFHFVCLSKHFFLFCSPLLFYFLVRPFIPSSFNVELTSNISLPFLHYWINKFLQAFFSFLFFFLFLSLSTLNSMKE